MTDWRSITKQEADAILAQPYVHPEPPAAERNGHHSANGKPASKPQKSKATGERFSTLNTFIDFTMGDLTPAEIKTWLAIYRDTRNGKAQSSVRSIARRAKVSVQHIHGALTRLTKLGLIERLHAGGFNCGASVYRVQSFPLHGNEEQPE